MQQQQQQQQQQQKLTQKDKALSLIKKHSFTGNDGLDYVESYVALNAIKLMEPCDNLTKQTIIELLFDLAREMENSRDRFYVKEFIKHMMMFLKVEECELLVEI